MPAENGGHVDDATQELIEVLSRFDDAASEPPPEITDAEARLGLERTIAAAIAGFRAAAPDAPAPALLGGYAREAIMRSDLDAEAVARLLDPLFEDLDALGPDASSEVVHVADQLTWHKRLLAGAWVGRALDHVLGHNHLALPMCLPYCDAETIERLASHERPLVRLAVLEHLEQVIRDPARAFPFELALVDRLTGDLFEPVAELARHVKEDRRLDEAVWALRDRPRTDPEHERAREAMRAHRRKRPPGSRA